MPLSKRLARFNRRITNRALGTVAPYLLPMAVVIHRGRRSGRRYSTPVLAFPTDGGYAIALTYGPDTDWVHNVQAAQGCLLRRRGREFHLTNPVILDSEGLELLPAALRPALRLLNVSKVLHLQQ
jgi:deazaflavin-dependent oxidoreductase (nitroreductase family)